MHPALRDLIIVSAGAILTAFVASVLHLPMAGQIAIVVGVMLSTWRLSLSSERWRDLGLGPPGNALYVLLAAFALYLLTMVGMITIVLPLSQMFGARELDLSAYGEIKGNATSLTFMLLIVWSTVAFGEEMIFRGFMMHRIRQLMGPGHGADAVAIGTQALLFGLGHFYLGLRGVLTATFIGVLYGTWFVMRNRSLWPLICAHGFTDTVTLVAIYRGAA
jgi:uncharacterized protein